MNRLFIVLLLVVISTLSYAKSLVITDNGKSNHQIVVPVKATPEEKKAAQILAESIKKTTGAELVIINEEMRDIAKPSFFIGKTDFAIKKVGLVSESNGEDWQIVSDFDNIVIYGGNHRGTLYGVFDFIEKFLNVGYYGLGIAVFPENVNLSIPLPLQIKKQPAFKFRSIYYVTEGIDTQKFSLFNSQIGINGYGQEPEYGFSEKYGRPIGCHSYLYYAQDFPVEISWMAPNGKRVKVTQTTQGQICYSNSEVRKRFIEKLKNYIAKDRQEADRMQAPYPIFYDISANDCRVECFCAECKKKAEQYGLSGMVIDFTNHIAAAIEEEYPDIFIMMFAYNNASLPPSNISARDNVIVRVAFMDSEFGDNEKRDVFRSIAHPFNHDYVNSLNEWHKIAKNIAIWDYWKHYKSIAPKTLVKNLPQLIQTYHKLGVKHFFVEAEITGRFIQPDSFIDLRTYAGAKLMVDPYLNMEALLNDFFKNYYGPAAVPMREYFEYLTRRMDEEPSRFGGVAVEKWQYLDADFFKTAERLFSDAEVRCNGDRKYLNRIGLERLVVDITQIQIGKKFQSSPNNLDNSTLLERIIANIDVFGNQYFNPEYWNLNREKNIKYFTSILQKQEIPLPEKFQGKDVIDISWDKISSADAVNDSNAAGGKTVKVSDLKYTGTKPFHGRNPEFGLYDSVGKKVLLRREIPKSELPGDEEYHWYFLGRANIPQQSRLWVHWTWWLTVPLSTVYDQTLADTPRDIYISMKCHGPSYVSGSKLADAIMIDRILLVKESIFIPDELKNTNAIKIPYSGFVWKTRYLTDEDSPEKMAAGPITSSDNLKFHSSNPSLGAYDSKTKKYLAVFELKAGQIPQDEKYHLYKIGKTKLTEDTTIWGHASWSMVCAVKGKSVNYDIPYTIYVSLKLQGPSYVKNSTKANDFLIDSLYLVPSK